MLRNWSDSINCALAIHDREYSKYLNLILAWQTIEHVHGGETSGLGNFLTLQSLGGGRQFWVIYLFIIIIIFF